MPSLRVVLVVALLVAGCSGDDGGSGDDPDASGTSSVPVSSVVSTTTLRPPVPTDPAPLPNATIGELVIPCSPVDATELPDRPGITADTILIGTGSDRGGIATPGAGVGIAEMVETLADHCNASGGLHGRDVQVVEYDAAAEEATARVRAACEEVVALVGHAFLQLVEEVLTALDCGLARYPAAGDLLPPQPRTLHGHLTGAFADPAATQIALVGPDTAAAGDERAAHRAAIEATGGPLAVVTEIAYPIDRQPDWDRLVGEARFSGAGQVFVVGGCDQAVVPFASVAEAAGWSPVLVATATAYDPACLEVPSPDRFFVEVPFLPFEDGDAAPATAEHAALLDRVAAPRTGNAILAASAFWRWAVDAAACLGEVDADCAAPIGDGGWTGGGLHVPVAADGSTGGCAVVVGIEDGAFVRRLPVEPGTYACDDGLSVVPPDPPGEADEDPAGAVGDAES